MRKNRLVVYFALLSPLGFACAAPSTLPEPTPSVAARSAADPLAAVSLPTVQRRQRRRWKFGAVGLLGGRQLFHSSYGGLDEHGVLGFEFDARPATFPIGIEAGAAATGDFDDHASGTFLDLESTTGEFYFGPRATIDFTETDLFHGYVGTGISFQHAELERLTTSLQVREDDDSAIGGYLHGGFYFHVSRGLRMGLDVRWIYASNIELFDEDAGLESLQVAFLIGGAW